MRNHQTHCSSPSHLCSVSTFDPAASNSPDTVLSSQFDSSMPFDLYYWLSYCTASSPSSARVRAVHFYILVVIIWFERFDYLSVYSLAAFGLFCKVVHCLCCPVFGRNLRAVGGIWRLLGSCLLPVCMDSRARTSNWSVLECFQHWLWSDVFELVTSSSNDSDV